MKPEPFRNKMMVVTGAAQGIGREVAMRAAADGARLALVDRSDLVEKVAAEIGALGGFATAILADLEHWEGAKEAIATAIRRLGRIDILVNNVGGAIWMRPFEHFDDRQIEAEIRRSLFPTMWCCRAVLPSMIEARSGVIVNVSSIATRGINRVPYSAAKGAVNALTIALAMENAERGIRVNAVASGGTEAPPRQIPRNTENQTEDDRRWVSEVVRQTTESSLMKRYGTLEEQANVILFMASDEASYLTGTILPVGGGDTG
ncbi:1,6-dihydroxycyclohexa-2,4-diene-1-carboxylate dehydrogenase [Phyllobacterium brassicacearum]|uniref:1,6-dihydroxycyclohexa-2,4-diene-1-carboxylate dehydrogenase n=1 Tax=Phyllobacterium brassicacearum TaxID=314235 RepID=A0A2P7BVG2_9HYPH|nr:benzoate diol dehydrogenase BenD [Phyllobacterium brassicacearum]PSH70436.1 1,6-dihydroxycyclohexa-2,4-diene-1-carboxylate dehydrogenase [Phyllobacterium brassicacearum]TDQ27957.1 1,2-dihydroxycyclohexa-3,5-diene-1-carboxylate dehydrogenase [Phyllobacterium brassicacearum]